MKTSRLILLIPDSLIIIKDLQYRDSRFINEVYNMATLKLLLMIINMATPQLWDDINVDVLGGSGDGTWRSSFSVSGHLVVRTAKRGRRLAKSITRCSKKGKRSGSLFRT